MSVNAGQNEGDACKDSLIIPVGQEPRRQDLSLGQLEHPVVGCRTTRRQEPAAKPERADWTPRRSRRGVKSTLKNRANTLRVFTVETMGSLTKAEIQVWLAIFNCEFDGLAQIGYSRLCEITKLSRRHVGKAVNSLQRQGLLEVVVRGRFQPSQSRQPANTHPAGKTVSLGQPSIYKIYARPNKAPVAGDLVACDL